MNAQIYIFHKFVQIVKKYKLNLSGPTKVKTHKPFLFTEGSLREGSLELKIKKLRQKFMQTVKLYYGNHLKVEHLNKL